MSFQRRTRSNQLSILQELIQMPTPLITSPSLLKLHNRYKIQNEDTILLRWPIKHMEGRLTICRSVRQDTRMVSGMATAASPFSCFKVHSITLICTFLGLRKIESLILARQVRTYLNSLSIFLDQSTFTRLSLL